jgi:hypothetical protein
MRHLAAATALALLCACAAPSYTDGSNPINGPDGGGSGGPIDGGDGGTDGGADSGVDAGPDAGCVPRSFNSAGIVDSCASGSPQNGTVTGSVEDAGHGCAVNLTLTTPTASCVGVASGGSANAFTGTCGAMPCASASLPGTLSCNTGAANCTIQISCDAGTCP